MLAGCELFYYSLALYDVIDDGEFDTVKRILESLADPSSVINRYFRGPNTLLYR